MQFLLPTIKCCSISSHRSQAKIWSSLAVPWLRSWFPYFIINSPKSILMFQTWNNYCISWRHRNQGIRYFFPCISNSYLRYVVGFRQFPPSSFSMYTLTTWRSYGNIRMPFVCQCNSFDDTMRMPSHSSRLFTSDMVLNSSR